MAAFCTALIGANLIGPGKVVTLWGFTFGAGVLFFPIIYLFGDFLTEVYGYARSRKVVWAGFISLAFITLMSWVVVGLPPAADWPHQAAYETVFGSTPRIVAGSMLAYFFGEFFNSYTLAKMKLLTNGRLLFVRTIGSTIVGEGVDTLIFYPIAFGGIWPNSLLFTVMLSNYVVKILWEVLATPFTYRFVAWLKRVENEDYYDRSTDFNPFSIKT